MNDFTILHLSDLHIDREDGEIPVMLNNLLDDIKKELEDVDNIVILVTGDIVNKGNYKAKESVLAFFRKLKEMFQERCVGIYIVPGNHDKVRSVLDEKLILGNGNYSEQFYKEEWKYVLLGFQNYSLLCKDIYKIFYKENDGYPYFEDTYGVSVKTINGKDICFLLFNSAWSCMGDNDEHNIYIGEFQMNQMKKSYNEKRKNRTFDLVVAIAHHPINLLESMDEDKFRNLLLSEIGLNANVYICGHIHNRDVTNWYNNRHSLTTLVSGVGEQDKDGNHPYAHNYASYCFNLDLNSIDVYARSSDDALNFDSDFRIYTQVRNKQENKIVMPIWSGKRQGYFNLHVGGKYSVKSCYITDNMLEGFKDYSKMFRNVRSDIQQRIEAIKCEFLLYYCDLDYLESIIRHFYGSSYLDRKKVFKYMRKNKDIMRWINNSFTIYLQQICYSFFNGIKKLVVGDIRVHIRMLNIIEDSYYEVCMAGDVLDHHVEKLKWGQLIEKAYLSKTPLIASANKMWCKASFENNENKEETKKWTDFITAIPNANCNNYKKVDHRTGETIKERPYFTFGVTVYQDEDRTALFMLEYMEIDIMLGELLQDFIYNFPLKIGNWKNNI